MVPAVLVELAEDRGGIGEVDSVDFLVSSTAVGAAVVITAAVLFGRAVRHGHPVGDVVVAAFDGIVVTVSVAVMGLIAFLLLHVREEKALGEGVGIELTTWFAIQLLSAAVGLVAGRGALRWLAHGQPPSGTSAATVDPS